jgi:hypothetical protein
MYRTTLLVLDEYSTHQHRIAARTRTIPPQNLPLTPGVSVSVSVPAKHAPQHHSHRMLLHEQPADRIRLLVKPVPPLKLVKLLGSLSEVDAIDRRLVEALGFCRGDHPFELLLRFGALEPGVSGVPELALPGGLVLGDRLAAEIVEDDLLQQALQGVRACRCASGLSLT